jgi:hypothetical protein
VTKKQTQIHLICFRPSPSLTNACKRLPIAYARSSLRPLVAPEARRWVARAAGGWRGAVPPRGGVGRGWERSGTRAGRPWRAELRGAPWARGGGVQAGRPRPTQLRTGADRAQGGLYPGGCRPRRGGSPRAFGTARRRSMTDEY